MAEIVGIYDGGVIVDRHKKKVGVVIFKIVTNESAPEVMIGHCHPNYRDSIIKNLKRLAWQKPEIQK